MPSDPVLELCKTGNVYRHLDEANDIVGAAQRGQIGLKLEECVAGTQPPHLADALGMCMLVMGAFNPVRQEQVGSQANATARAGEPSSCLCMQAFVLTDLFCGYSGRRSARAAA